MSLDFKKIQEKSFVDIPSSEPKIRLALSRVGISNRPLVIKLKNPLNGEVESMAANLRIASSLSAGQRGIHMSRIEECMDEIKDTGLSPRNFSLELGKLINKTQQQDESFVELEARLEHRVGKNKSGKSSTEILNIFSEASVGPSGDFMKSGISVPFMNACPCTQRWAIRDYYNLLKEKGIPEDKAQELASAAPLQAHTNGGLAALFITGPEICYKDIYAVLDNSVPIIRELLKGIDEHTFVSMTHRQGQFCEDNIRAIAKNTVELLSEKIPGNASIRIKVEVNESVHFHNLWSEIEKPFSELKSEISEASL
jgi:GTP cyclohydrolase FolE2